MGGLLSVSEPKSCDGRLLTNPQLITAIYRTVQNIMDPNYKGIMRILGLPLLTTSTELTPIDLVNAVWVLQRYKHAPYNTPNMVSLSPLLNYRNQISYYPLNRRI